MRLHCPQLFAHSGTFQESASSNRFQPRQKFHEAAFDGGTHLKGVTILPKLPASSNAQYYHSAHRYAAFLKANLQSATMQVIALHCRKAVSSSERPD